MSTIVQERELGTLERLVVSPIQSSELMLGKLIPLMSVGFVMGTLVSTVAMTYIQAVQLIQLLLIPIASMPPALQAISYLVPLTYFLTIVRGIIQYCRKNVVAANKQI